MGTSQSDALVFFGATGDLAFKKIFPALQAMVKRGHLDVPVIGVGRSAWTVDQFQARARESLEQHGEVDPAAWEKLCGLLRYVHVDYADPTTFQALRKELGGAERPLYYLAIPPSLFTTVQSLKVWRSQAASMGPACFSKNPSAETWFPLRSLTARSTAISRNRPSSASIITSGKNLSRI